MELNEYQKQAMTTCMDSSKNFAYMAFNLVGEVGEFASKVAKQIRKKEVTLVNNSYFQKHYDEVDLIEELQLECGDILWQLFGLMSVMEWEAEDIARMNLDKLAARKKAGTIIGNGDGVTKEERL